MEMQDKEFDELFRSKLDNFEAEPSAGVWTGIAGGLAAGKRKKYLLPFLSIAASLLILVAAGVIFIPHDIKNPAQNRIAKTVPKTTIIRPSGVDSNHNTLQSTKPNGLNETLVAVNRKNGLHPAVAVKNLAVAGSPKPKIDPGNPVKRGDQTELASSQPKQQEMIKAVVPDENIPLGIKQPIEEMSLNNKPRLVTAQLPVDKTDGAPVKQKHKIRSLGDFINVVVAQVDKRRDKIIEFSDTDDDESMVTGVNLGIIKLKKEK